MAEATQRGADPAPPDDAELDAAAESLAGVAHRTPILRSSILDRRLGARLYFKCENFQRVGAFKFRGAFHTLSSLDADARRRGVVTHSSGNHAQAVALAAALLGVPATIVMPENAPRVKVAAVRGYLERNPSGRAELLRCAPTHTAREETARAALERTDGELVHPFDDSRVIAGQSTATRELHEDAPEALDYVLAPVGGGGLVSGACLVTRRLGLACHVVGAEPEGADDAARSFRAGSLQPLGEADTVADGLRTPLSPRTFAILHGHLHDLVTVSDDEIIAAMRLVWERMKILIEPSCAVPLAALLAGRCEVAGRAVGILLSGGNVDLDALPWTKH